MRQKDRLFTVNKWNKKKLYWAGGDTSGQNTSVLVQDNPYSKRTDRSTSDNTIATFPTSGNNALQGTQNTELNIIGTPVNTAVGQPKEGVTYTDESYLSPAWLDTVNQYGQYANGVASSLNQKTGDSGNSLPLSTASSLPSWATAWDSGTSAVTSAAKPTASVVIESVTPTSIWGDAGSSAASALSSPSIGTLASPTITPLSDYATIPDSVLKTTSGGAGALGRLSNAFGANNLSSLESAGLGIGASIVGGIGKNLISNGFDTNTGNTIATVGNVAGGVVGAINPIIGAGVTLAGNLIGGVVNAGWGHKTYGTGEAQNYLNNTSGISLDHVSNDSLAKISSSLPTANTVTYKDGWFTHKGRNQARSWNKKLQERSNYLQETVNNAAQNNNTMQLQNLLANYSALGGPLNTDNNMGAIEYGLMSDYLLTKQKQAQSKDKGNTNLSGTFFDDGGIMIKPSHQGRLTELKKRTGKTEEELYNDGNPAHKKMVVFARNSRKWNKHSMGGDLFRDDDSMFALGGTLEAGGVNWGNFTEVNTGGSHESNPNGGVQMGVDNEGTPNLVEENEVIYNDYVFSARLKCPEDIRRGLGVKGKKDMSFADVAKKLSKESEERPNDTISKDGLKALMGDLAEAQEGVKQQLEAEKARAEFESLSPEEQMAIMNQRSQDEALAQQQAQQQALQQQAAQEQAMQQQAQMTPDEMAMVQQQQAQGNMSANGGKLFKDGGKKYKSYAAMGNYNLANNGASGLPINGDYQTWDAFTYGDNIPIWVDDNYIADYGNASAASEGYQNSDFYKWLASDQGNAFRNMWWTKSNAPNFYKQNDEGYVPSLNDLVGVNGKAGLMFDRNYGDAHRFGAAAFDQYMRSAGAKPATTTVPEFYYTDDKGNSTLISTGDLDPEKWADYPMAERYKAEGNKYYYRNPTEAETDANGSPVVDKNGNLTAAAGTRAAGNGTNGTGNGTGDDVVARHRWEGLRYAPVLGAATGIGLWAAGVGKPDYSNYNAALEASSVEPIMAGVEHIGDYMRYRPFDRDYYINKLNAQTGATRRNILNSGATPQRAAALLAADYNAQGKIGDLARQAEEYNLEQRAKVAEFNRGTNQFNASADNAALSQYADAYNRQKQFHAQMLMEAAQQRAAADAAWNQGLYANIGDLASSLGAIGKENAYMNMRNKMAANGVFGLMDAEDEALGSTALKTKKKKSNTSANGGKLKRKKRGGLTF